MLKSAKAREKFYDEKIAPELARLARMCQDNGLAFLAGVEWDPGHHGRTVSFPKGTGEAMRRADAALLGEYGVGAVAITITKEL